MSSSAEALVNKEGISVSHLKVLYTGAAQGSALISAALRYFVLVYLYPIPES